MSDEAAAYLEARHAYNEGKRKIEVIAATLRYASDALLGQPHKFGFFTNTDDRAPRTSKRVDALTVNTVAWKSPTEIEAAVNEFKVVRDRLVEIWGKVPAKHRSGLHPPPDDLCKPASVVAY
jgi:hypothetical protein